MKKTKEEIISAVGYLPVLGWFYPLFLLPKSVSAQYHGKRAFVISVALILGFLLSVTLRLLLPIFFSRVIFFVLAIYTLFLCYFAVKSAVEILRAREASSIPIIEEFAKMLNI